MNFPSTAFTSPALEFDMEVFQRDLRAIREYINQFAGISNEDLVRLNISAHLNIIQECLLNISINWAEIGKVRNTVGNSENCVDESRSSGCPVEDYWSYIREEARRANELVYQLGLSIGKIRAGLLDFDHFEEVPRDIREMNMVLDNALSLLTFDWAS